MFKSILLAMSLMINSYAFANPGVEVEWGQIVTPLSEDVTFSFTQNDITKNFTDIYSFSLIGEAGTQYAVTFTFDPCLNGCGNPAISYGIYSANGGLVTSTAGEYVLGAGDYEFKVIGTGFGAGNEVDYSGSVTFSNVTDMQMVSPTPELPPSVLMLLGIAGVLLYLNFLKKHETIDK